MPALPVIEVEDETMMEDDIPPPDEIFIPLPEGFEVPAGTQEGGSFEVIAKMRLQAGQLVVESLDGREAAAPVEETVVVEEDPAEVALEDEEEDFRSQLSNARRMM